MAMGRLWRRVKVGYEKGTADQTDCAPQLHRMVELWTKPGMTRGCIQIVSAKLPAGYLISDNHPPTEFDLKLADTVYPPLNACHDGINNG